MATDLGENCGKEGSSERWYHTGRHLAGPSGIEMPGKFSSEVSVDLCSPDAF
jgi:hypothetical protein